MKACLHVELAYRRRERPRWLSRHPEMSRIDGYTGQVPTSDFTVSDPVSDSRRR
ncbi:MAG: hypothetical protein QNJ19_14120 [Woeseiaceae bacterium]|nr:hypothetical protein [Woeseiaceae bacterium]